MSCRQANSKAESGFPSGEAILDDTDSANMLRDLREEHRDLDAEITALEASAPVDQIRTSRLKKRKLQIKDMIARLEDSDLPDIIA